jgi:alpha-beta hydrolase superfamily lysophospholipase
MLLTIVIMAIACGCRVRDLAMKRVSRIDVESVPEAAIMKHWIPSGRHRLDAVLATPIDSTVRATVFICHGIGETVENWLPVQRMLASRGVASLVFDYAGYGRSTGFFSPSRAESNALAAFDWLRQVAPTAPIWQLGFSLGSGIAASVAAGMSVSGLVLCAAFTSLREGAVSCGFPRYLAFLVPPIWRNAEELVEFTGDLLIVHGEDDELFPVRMADELSTACAGSSSLVVVPGLVHDEPHRRPTHAYWDTIVAHVMPHSILAIDAEKAAAT